MFSRVLRDLAKPALPALIDSLKRSQGLSVGELAEALGMSYMGVKQYCVDLHKRGYLDTWRRPQPNGRPELAYRLTPKAQALFPQSATPLTLDLLEAVHQLHGATAVEKVLFHYFNRQTEALAQRLPDGPPLARLEALAKLRDAEGRFVQLHHSPEEGLALIEYHQPHAALAERYPVVLKLEEALLSRLLNTPVTRETRTASGLTMTLFRLPGWAGLVPDEPFPVIKPKKPALRKRSTRRKTARPAEEAQQEPVSAPAPAPAPAAVPSTELTTAAAPEPELAPAPITAPEPITAITTVPTGPESEEALPAPAEETLPPTAPALVPASAATAHRTAPEAPALLPTRSNGFQQSDMLDLLLNS